MQESDLVAEARERGARAGRLWREELATSKELERLAPFHPDANYDFYDVAAVIPSARQFMAHAGQHVEVAERRAYARAFLEAARTTSDEQLAPAVDDGTLR